MADAAELRARVRDLYAGIRARGPVADRPGAAVLQLSDAQASALISSGLEREVVTALTFVTQSERSTYYEDEKVRT
jgi:hypothetical protein